MLERVKSFPYEEYWAVIGEFEGANGVWWYEENVEEMSHVLYEKNNKIVKQYIKNHLNVQMIIKSFDV